MEEKCGTNKIWIWSYVSGENSNRNIFSELKSEFMLKSESLIKLHLNFMENVSY